MVEFKHIKAPKAVPLHHCDLASRENLLQDGKEECAGHRKRLKTSGKKTVHSNYSQLTFFMTLLKLCAASNQNAEV